VVGEHKIWSIPNQSAVRMIVPKFQKDSIEYKMPYHCNYCEYAKTCWNAELDSKQCNYDKCIEYSKTSDDVETKVMKRTSNQYLKKNEIK
jgi:hypothetical protein